jgi:exodeoxyribonuclease-3
LISWNVNGIRAVHKKNLFLPFVQKYSPDVICLQETKAEKGQAVIDLPQYEEYWNSAKKKGYSGVAVFVRTNTNKADVKKEKDGLTVHSVQYGFPEEIYEQFGFSEDKYGDPNDEGRIVAVELDEVFVVTCYTPNSKPDLSRLKLRHEQWDPAFLAYMKQLEEEKPVIFCGDLNAAHTPDDLANAKANEGEHGYTTEEREGIDKIISAGFVDTFRLFTKGPGHYTWWSHFALSRERNVGWRIDYFFASRSLASKIKKSIILPEVMGSDHCPVLLELK